MNSRELELVALRPKILSAIVNPLMSFDEQFQNKTLRPVVKLQNELFILVFRNYISKHKNVFYTLSLDRKLVYIENAIQKDIKFRNSIKGMIIGQFTIDEYEMYIQNSSSLNKRMMNLVIERLKSNIQLLDYESVH